VSTPSTTIIAGVLLRSSFPEKGRTTAGLSLLGVAGQPIALWPTHYISIQKYFTGHGVEMRLAGPYETMLSFDGPFEQLAGLVEGLVPLLLA